MSRIRKEDIFDPKLFTQTTAEIQTMINVVKELKAQMLELMKVSKQALIKTPDNSTTLRKQQKATQDVTNAEKNLIALEKERVRLLAKFNQSAEKQAKNNQRLKIQTQERNKQLKQQVKEELGLVGAYQKQSQTLAQLRRRYKDLVVSGKANTRQARLLQKQVQSLDAKLKRVDASAGQFQRNVGNYGNRLKQGFTSLMGAFGVTAGLFGLVRGLRSVTKIVVDFDKTMANLGAISQATDEELQRLNDNARQLGESTQFSASEVAELSTELAKLGFDTQQIIDSSEAILNLAAATGTDLAESAKIAGSTMRAFNLDATEMDRVTSVLGVATTKSALNMEFFNTAMSKVAPVAQSLGFNIEDTTALLGGLANAGFDASTAATSTRSILLKLADSGGELAQALGEPVTNLDDLIPALQKLDAQGVDLAQSLELTDKRSVAAFNTFLKGTDTLSELRNSITDVNDELQDMADKQLDTVAGQVRLLNSRFQELVLGFSEGISLTDRLKGALAFLRNNLENIFRIIKFVTIAFVSYKTAIIASNVAIKLYRTLTIGARIATIAFSGGLKGATRAMKLLNTSIKANPIGLIVSGLTTAIALFMDFSDEVDESAEALDRLANAYKKLRTEQDGYFAEADQEQNVRLAKIDLEIAKAKEQGASAEQLHKLSLKRIDEEKRANQIKDFRAFDALQEMIKLRDEAKQTLDNDNAQLERSIKLQQSSSRSIRQKGKEDEKFYTRRIKNSQLTFDNAQKEVEAQQKLLDDLENERELLDLKAEKSTVELNIQLKKNKEQEKTNSLKKKENIFQTELLKLLKQQRRVIEDIEQLELDRKIDRYNKRADEFLKSAIDQAKILDNIDPEGNLDVNDITEVPLNEYKNELDLRFLAQKDSAKSIRDFKIKELQVEFTAFVKNTQKQLDEERITAEERSKLIKKATKNLNKEKELLEKQYQDKIREFDQQRVDDFADAQKQIKDISTNTINDALTDLDKLEDIRLEKLSNTIQKTNALLDAFQQRRNQRTDEQIQNIDKEIEASKRRFDELKKLSIEGNIDADKSALAEVRRQEELEQQKAKLQRRQQLLEAGIAAFKVFASKVEQGEKNPLASTITDVTALTAFIQSLPTFYEGTENVGDSLGAPDLKGKDGHIVRVDKDERIVDPVNNSKLKGVSNDQLGDMVEMYKNNKFNGLNMNKLNNNAYQLMANQMTLNYQLSKQLHKLNSSNNQIINAIQNIPHESWDYDKMTDAVIKKVKTQKTTHRKHYKNNTLH